MELSFFTGRQLKLKFKQKNVDERIEHPGPWWLENATCHFFMGNPSGLENVSDTEIIQ